MLYSCLLGCFWCQRYKIWKQFTTMQQFWCVLRRLFLMSKIQNLKAIHNTNVRLSSKNTVVSDVKDTKFESNSQRCFAVMANRSVVSDVKDTKFESNSQRQRPLRHIHWVVSDVKDTKFESNSQHPTSANPTECVVSDVKDTKFESNSQLNPGW